MSVGILSCGAGYRPRQQGYLAFTGPTKIRLEVPRDPIEEFALPPLHLGKKDPLDDIPPMEMQTVKTNKIPPMREQTQSISSQPPAQQPPPSVVIPAIPPVAYSFEDLMKRGIPSGFEDLLDQNDPFLDEPTTTKEVMELLMKDGQTNDPSFPLPTVPLAPGGDTQTLTNAPPNTTTPQP